MSNLKSCPFCGGDMIVCKIKDTSKTYTNVSTCKKCGASGPLAKGERNAIRLSNTRYFCPTCESKVVLGDG